VIQPGGVAAGAHQERHRREVLDTSGSPASLFGAMSLSRKAD
jgi:hypothetical protein